MLENYTIGISAVNTLPYYTIGEKRKEKRGGSYNILMT
jgi:hypothetical protein